MDKVKIELDEATARKFELFCLIEDIAYGKPWKYTKSQNYPDGRAIIHIVIQKDLTKE